MLIDKSENSNELVSKSPSEFEQIVKAVIVVNAIDVVVIAPLIVILPVTSKVEPSKVKFASPFNPEPVPVTTLLFESFARESEASS